MDFKVLTPERVNTLSIRRKKKLLKENEKKILNNFLEKRKFTKIVTKFPETIDGLKKKEKKNLPELNLYLDDKWREIFNSQGKLEVRIHNSGVSPAYNAFVEIYQTPFALVGQGPILTHNKKFSEKKYITLDTIFPNQDVFVSIHTSPFYLLGMLYEPYFLNCYDILQDPKQNVNLEMNNNLLEAYLSLEASHNRKMLYIPRIRSNVLELNDYIKSKIRLKKYRRKFKKSNYKRRK